MAFAAFLFWALGALLLAAAAATVTVPIRCTRRCA